MASPPQATATPDAEAVPEGHVLLDSIQRDKLSIIGHMASSIAHELSNPLAAIVASTQAILSFWPSPGTPGAPLGTSRDPWSPPSEFLGHGVPLRQLREDLELILEEARRAGDIVHGLLASARQNAPEWRICSMADVVRRTVALCRHHLKLHNISLQAPYFDPHEGYPLWSRVRGDANQLQQVLLNLIINAQQAISAYRGYGTVRVTLSPDGPDRVIVTVEDDGPGVPETERETIFRPFYTTKPAGQGTGLGLSISAEIIRAHGGQIAARPHPNGGALFRLELPSLAAAERARGPEASDLPATVAAFPDDPTDPARAEATLRRVLLVDDEVGIRRSVGRFLRRYGYQVTDVPNAQAGLNALRNGRYDVVVSDLRMPGLSGEEFYSEVQREFPALADRVLFTSGDMLREETQKFLEESGRPALQKPYELSDLIRVIATLCPPAGLTQRASA
jgi:signal transduction histidine kinase/CheY-like chemotaxis protein